MPLRCIRFPSRFAAPIKVRQPTLNASQAKVRQDPYGNPIKKDQYGNDGLYGWETDHIKPTNKGGSDNLRNLQAMQTSKNRELGDTLKKRSRHKQK